MHWIRGKTLGKGGFAFVSMATTHSETGATHLPPVIAVKSATISNLTSLSEEKELLDKFKGCPYILRCFGDEFTTENGQHLYNILLEYAPGGCLADRLHSGLPEHVVRHCTRSLLTALVHIHKLGYVHCDIKPHNVLFLDDGFSSVRLADFGSCKTRAVTEDDAEGFRGTVLYAAPESIARQEYLPESDVWALGCTVLQMLTGKSPWKFDRDATAKDVMLTIGCGAEIPEIPTGRKVTEEAKDFLRKCFVKDPARRWKAEMLLEHPFVKTAAGKTSCRRQFTSRVSHGIHSLIPHCFHDPRISTVHHC